MGSPYHLQKRNRRGNCFSTCRNNPGVYPGCGHYVYIHTVMIPFIITAVALVATVIAFLKLLSEVVEGNIVDALMVFLVILLIMVLYGGLMIIVTELLG